MEQINQELLKILACPKCKTSVVLDGNTLKCTNTNCGLVYPIRNGIPVMLVEEAEKASKT
ncbi:MAG: Trm112 family protein [Kiritimatiellae bacterium]|nr:Trm112 family protein [Kiritimatiellia bacterium]MDD5522163.1 Trm112 family protein [Kiritimatiellia bacterium]